MDGEADSGESARKHTDGRDAARPSTHDAQGTSVKTVAVLGGGPAGAMAARQLAVAGVRTILFDEKLAWEKPCGGGVTFKAYQQYPFLLDSGRYRSVSRTCLHAAEAGPTRLGLAKPMLIFSRKELNQLLLERAAAAGAE